MVGLIALVSGPRIIPRGGGGEVQITLPVPLMVLTGRMNFIRTPSALL